MIGGTHRPRAARALSSTNTSTIGAATAASDPTARTRSVPNRRNTPATMPITIGMGMRSMTRRTQPVSPRTSTSSPVATNAPTTSGHGVAERRPDEDRPGDRPEEGQRLAVHPARHHGQQAVEEEHAEHPRRELGLRQAPMGADGQDHGDRTGGREDQADHAVRGVEQPQVPHDAAGPNQRAWGALHRRPPRPAGCASPRRTSQVGPRPCRIGRSPGHGSRSTETSAPVRCSVSS